MENNRFTLELSPSRSISDKVCDTLRIAILNKVFKPGERLVESKLAKEMNVSITPIRHAFTQLKKEGLIEIFPYKGTYIVDVDIKFIRDVSIVRLQLETLAAELSLEKITQQDINNMINIAKNMDLLAKNSKHEYESVKLDIKFHSIFFEKCSNELLIDLWTLLKPRLFLMHVYGNKKKSAKGIVEQRHMEIIKAIATYDKQTLVDAIKNHITTGQVMTIANLEIQ